MILSVMCGNWRCSRDLDNNSYAGRECLACHWRWAQKCVCVLGGGGGSSSEASKYRRCFFSPKRPHRLWGSPTLLFSGYRGLFFGGQSSRCLGLADHSPPTSAEVKNERCFTSAPPYAFTTCVGTTLPLYLDEVCSVSCTRPVTQFP
jgi:hypothetical protein